MLRTTLKGSGEWLSRLFPERQLIYRSRGCVRYAIFSRHVQIGLSAGICVAIIWALFASAILFVHRDVIAERERELAAVQHYNVELAQQLETTQDRFRDAAGALEIRHRQLVALVEERANLGRGLSSVSDRLRSVVGERDVARTKTVILHERVAALAGNVDSISTARRETAAALTTARARLRAVADERDAARAELTAHRSRVQRLEIHLGDLSDEHQAAVAALTDARAALATASQERDADSRARDELAERAGELEARLAALKDMQRGLIARIQAHTNSSVGALESMLSQTGLDIDALVAFDDGGRGGPLLDIDKLATAGAPDDSRFAATVVRLEHSLARWQDLRYVADRLPLAEPAERYWVSSGFGKRRNPFTKHWAMHSGLDLSGPYKSAIGAAAPGIVVVAGRSGPYGRLVEIDHGLGIATRYAHLHSILVERGRTVDRGERIGLMGSSGRSTGPHLHYEVRVNGRHHDPAKFLKAGQHVLQD